MPRDENREKIMDYADKVRTLEYIIVMIDEFMAEIKKHLHYASYQIYDENKVDTEFMKALVRELDDHVDELVKIYDKQIPAEKKRIDFLEKENSQLKEIIIRLENELDGKCGM